MANTGLVLSAQRLRDLSIILKLFLQLLCVPFCPVRGCENEDACMLNNLLKTRKKHIWGTTFSSLLEQYLQTGNLEVK